MLFKGTLNYITILISNLRPLGLAILQLNSPKNHMDFRMNLFLANLDLVAGAISYFPSDSRSGHENHYGKHKMT